LKKYTLVFAIAYLVLTVVVTLIIEMLDVIGGNSANFAVALGASFIAAAKFSREQRRLPTVEEKRTFAWQGLLSVWAISLVLAIAVFTFLIPELKLSDLLGLLRDPTILAIAVIAAGFISAIYYVAIRWSFSWYTRVTLKSAK